MVPPESGMEEELRNTRAMAWAYRVPSAAPAVRDENTAFPAADGSISSIQMGAHGAVTSRPANREGVALRRGSR